MGQMIKFEHNTLVLNNVFSKQDVAEIDRFAEYVRNEERERIIKLLEHRLYPIYYPKSKLSGGGEGELIGEIIALIKEDKVSGYQK